MIVAQAIQNCPPDPGDPCKSLRDLLSKLIYQTKADQGTRGLRERVMQQINGENGPGTPEWNGHKIQIQESKNQIRKVEKKFKDEGCGDKTPLGPDLKYWLNRSNPADNEWKDPRKRLGFNRETIENITGLTGTAAIAYFIISEGSRVVFPPRNLVPVP